MESLCLLTSEKTKFSNSEMILMTVVATLLGVMLAGPGFELMGLLVSAGCVGFAVRGVAKDLEKYIKSETYKLNGILKTARALAGVLAQFSVCQIKIVVVTGNRFNRDSVSRQHQSLSIPHPALSARLYPAPIAFLA